MTKLTDTQHNEVWTHGTYRVGNARIDIYEPMRVWFGCKPGIDPAGIVQWGILYFAPLLEAEHERETGTERLH